MGDCAVCGKRIAPGLLMCVYHWRRVGRVAQQHVWRALHAYKSGSGPLADLRAAQARAVAEAR